MTIIIFLIILGALVLVHELGHFLVAKKAGVYVEEFGFGYPPRALTLGRRWGTLFSINWIPFGGFVKIFGENYEEAKSLELKAESKDNQSVPLSSKPKALSFLEISKKWQAAILVAGVTFNILFAWILFSFGFMIGLPTPVENDFGGEVRNPRLTITGVMPDSPAFKAGLKSGDKILALSEGRKNLESVTAEGLADFVNTSQGELLLKIERGEESLDISITPDTNLVPDKKLIGINMDMVGTLSLSPIRAFYEGARVTTEITYLTTIGLFELVRDSIFGKADLSSITGPVGIVGLVGDASRLGFAYLLTFTSLISINLAIINLIPFPALDGGRLLFVGIEAVTRKKINSKFAQITNTVSFALLIALMFFVTYRDVLKLF